MICHQHSTNNMLLGKPASMTDEQCISVPATLIVEGSLGQPEIQTFWRPLPEELAALNRGASVVLTVVGSGHPPVKLEVTEYK